MRIDYVRVYQRVGHTNVGCSPPDYPTADYIQSHLAAYTSTLRCPRARACPRSPLPRRPQLDFMVGGFACGRRPLMAKKRAGASSPLVPTVAAAHASRAQYEGGC